ncbi:MAG: peptidase [Actinomycetia bacterium]|nr:peptidase [Actinomycetes bacterium]
MGAVIVLLGILAFLVFVGFATSVRVVQQFEQGIVFRFGKVQLNGVRQAGLTSIVPIADRMQKVNMQTVAMGVPAQDGITQDNVSVRVDAVVYFRVIDPIKAVVNIQNYAYAISQVSQTSLRSVIGKADMQALLSERDTINAELRQIMDEMTENPWGRPDRAGRDQGRLAARGHEAVDGAAGRGGAGAAGSHHHGRW